MTELHAVWQNRESTCCNGKFMRVAEPKKLIATALLINILTILHQILHLGWFSSRNNFWPSYITLGFHTLVDVMLLKLMIGQPGILLPMLQSYETDKELIDVPLNKKVHVPKGFAYVLPIRTQLFKIKYCRSCYIFRPPRTSHCDVCGFCVQRFDHHCPWLGTCVGKRNYNTFYTFLFGTAVLIVSIIISCIIIMVNQSEGSIGATLSTYPMTIILTLVGFFFAIFVIGMLGLHTYFLIKNITTSEYLKDYYGLTSGNPFQKSFFLKHLINICWKFPKSLVNPRLQVYKQDQFISDPLPAANDECSQADLEKKADAINPTHLDLKISEETGVMQEGPSSKEGLQYGRRSRLEK